MKEAFNQAIQQIIKANEKMIIVSGIVKEVRADAIDVTRKSMPDIIDVRFNAVLNGVSNKFKIVPKVGTAVLCGIIESDISEAVLLTCGEVDKVEITIDTLQFELSNAGVNIKNQNENLKTVINDLIDELDKIKIIYGNDINHLQLASIKTRINKILV